MKIELKKIVINDSFSEETTCFHAELYINDLKVGYCENAGHGGNTNYRAIFTGVPIKEAEHLIKQAEEYCKTLPAVETAHGSIPMDLELFIDELVEEAAKQKEIKKLRKKIEKACIKSICWGNAADMENPVNGNFSYATMGWKIPLRDLLKTETGRIQLRRVLNDVRSQLKPGETIFNTNIPEVI